MPDAAARVGLATPPFATPRPTRAARVRDHAATVALAAIAGAILVALALMVGHIVASGAGRLLDWGFLTSKAEQFRAGGGIGPQIFNSLYLLVLTLVISLPVSLGAAVFLTQYAPPGPATAVARTAIEALSSLPSVVVGLFGMLAFVITLGWGFSILSGALALAMFNVPILVRVIQQALEAVPRQQRDAALALGLTRWEATVHVLIPCAMPAVVTGVVLSAGRVFGEAAALIYTAGQSAPALDWAAPITSLAHPLNLLRPAETLAVHIWKVNSEGVVPDLEAVSAGTAAVLMVSVLAFSLLARVLGRLIERRVSAR